MTFKEMQDAVIDELNESGEGIFHTRDIVKDRLNDALRDFAEETEYYTKEVAISLVANQLNYFLPDTDATVITLRRVYNDQTGKWLRARTIDEMDSGAIFWTQVSGAPEVAIPRGPLTVGIWPFSTVSSGTLTAKCSAIPAAMSADGDTVDIQKEYHRALVEYAKYELLLESNEFDKAIGCFSRYRAFTDAAMNEVSGRPSVALRGVIGG